MRIIVITVLAGLFTACSSGTVNEIETQATAMSAYEECMAPYTDLMEAIDEGTNEWNALVDANDPVYQQYTIGGPIGTGYEGWATANGYPIEWPEPDC